MVNVVTIAAYRRIYWLRLIGLVQRSAAVQPTLVLHLSDEPDELSQWQWHDDIIIIIIIIKAMRLTWYKCKSTARPRYNTRG